MLDEGASAAEVRVHASCSGFAATVTGSGRHRIDLPMTRTEESTEIDPRTDTEAQPGDAEEAGSGEGAEAGTAESGGGNDASEVSSDRCRVTFEANYQLVDTQTFGTAVLSLEQLAWIGD